MSLNKSKGNMYGWITHTWNSVSGICPHNCLYCYVKKFAQKDLYINRKNLNDDLGSNRYIFVGSGCDLFADGVPEEWIKETLDHCKRFDNKYLFQSKNPYRMYEMHKKYGLPPECVVGTTIESNRDYPVSRAPKIAERVKWMRYFYGDKMVSIEPVMDFDVNELHDMIKLINPKFVSIGADSKNSNLVEPSAGKLNELTERLKEITEVKIKNNLRRLW